MKRKRHGIRGFFSGLVMGVGLALVLMSHSVALFGSATPLVVVVACPLLGLAVGLAGPTVGKGTVSGLLIVLILLFTITPAQAEAPLGVP